MAEKVDDMNHFKNVKRLFAVFYEICENQKEWTKFKCALADFLTIAKGTIDTIIVDGVSTQ